jgi:hypothetical protein
MSIARSIRNVYINVAMEIQVLCYIKPEVHPITCHEGPEGE